MIISHKHKFICLDPPKTGTNYRQNWLSFDSDRIDELQHANLTEVKNHLQENFDDYFIFTFVRNPWVRYLSWFSFLNRNESNPNLTPKAFRCFMHSYFFGEYKDSGLRITLPQSFWFSDLNINFVGSLENMYEDLAFIMNHLNISTKLPSKPVNKSKHKLNPDVFYNTELIDFVSNHEKEVIELKGYNI